jgi:porphobilinogen synthase
VDNDATLARYRLIAQAQAEAGADLVGPSGMMDGQVAAIREALEEIGLDLAEGADMVMIKPALAYLDIIASARNAVDVPIGAYHVSGEYAMVQAAAQLGWIDGDAVAREHVTAIKRAGADFVLTYFARDLAERLG